MLWQIVPSENWSERGREGGRDQDDQNKMQQEPVPVAGLVFHRWSMSGRVYSEYCATLTLTVR